MRVKWENVKLQTRAKMSRKSCTKRAKNALKFSKILTEQLSQKKFAKKASSILVKAFCCLEVWKYENIDENCSYKSHNQLPRTLFKASLMSLILSMQHKKCWLNVSKICFFLNIWSFVIIIIKLNINRKYRKSFIVLYCNSTNKSFIK